jgi:Zn-finger in ubiquitin-hydrolases and other protein
MAESCTHLQTVNEGIVPSSTGCEDCTPIGGRWVHLRLCMHCGQVGCCDSSPNRHAPAHWHDHPDHPIIRSYEPGENWWWCHTDRLLFEIDGAPPAPSHP